MSDKKLPFLHKDGWRWRWMVLPGWKRLHRVKTIRKMHDEDWCPVGVEGTTVCGQSGNLVMPGFFSRVGLPRCAHCCRMLGLEVGDGAPYNNGIDA